MKNPDTPQEDMVELVKDTCYDVFNQVTAGANQMSSVTDQHKMWLVGGKLVEAINRPALGVEMN